MKFSIAKEIITPEKPVFMSGFGARTHKSEGIHDDLYVKVILLQANKALLTLAFDLLGGDRSFVHGIKNALKEKFGLQPDEILLNFSHTHSAVYVTGEDPGQRRGNYSIGQETWPVKSEDVDYTEDMVYFRYLRDKVVALVQRCFDQLQEGSLHMALGHSDAAVSRRLMTASGIRFAPNFDAPIDKDLFVLKLLDAKGDIKGVLFNYGCHPTLIGHHNYMISAEFVGYACTYLEGIYSGSTVAFLQGCAAELKPAKGVKDGSFMKLEVSSIVEVGTDLGRDVAEVIERGTFTKINCDFKSSLLDTKLHTEHVDVALLEKLLAETDSEFYQKSAKRLMESIKKGTSPDFLYIYIAIWHFGDDAKLIALEGEISTHYALMIKKLYKDNKTMVLGYSNGVFTYIPTRQILQEGGYEADHYRFHGLRGPFIPEVEEIIIGAIAKNDIIQGDIL